MAPEVSTEGPPPLPSLPVERPLRPFAPTRDTAPLARVEVRNREPTPLVGRAEAEMPAAAPGVAPVEHRLRVETRRTVERVEVGRPERMAPTPLFATPPRPTLPQAPAPTAPRLPQAGAAPPAPAAREPASELPEVIINIGRIEVKATPPPAKAKRPRRERPAMTRLGDYLGGGGGRA